jgi:hypothetical protein
MKRALVACVLAVATTAGADTPTDTTNADAKSGQSGLAIGVEAGEPTSATVGFFFDKLALLGAIGTGTRAGLGIQLHVDAQLIVARLRPDMPVRVGLGGRYYHHGYEAMSFDEIPDSHYGVRASVAVALERGPLQLYAELAPGVDIKRTTSCTLASGPYSVCPHAQANPLFLQLVVGARWFLSN